MDNTPAFQNNNPGNLKYAGQEGAMNNGGFAKFASPDDGYIALMNDVHGKVTGATSTGLTADNTLSDFASKYAPPTENNTDQYVLNLANQLKVPPDTKLSELQSRIPDIASAIAHNEDVNFASKYPLAQSSGYQPPVSPDSTGNMGSETQDNTGYAPPTPPQISTETAGSTPPAQPTPDTWGGEIGGRVNDINQAIGDYRSGKQGLLSTAIQSVGGVAGMLGDTVTKVIENTPVVGGVVKDMEGFLGNKVNDFLQTDSGKSIIQNVSKFAKDNPELSKDIGAGINIISAIPILKGLGVAANVAKDAASLALKGTAEKVATNGFSDIVSSTKTGIKALERNPTAISTLVSERALPVVEDGRWSTKEASQILGDNITHIDETELQPILEEISSRQSIGQNLSTLKNMAIKEAENDPSLKEAGVVPKAIKQIENRFEGWQHSYGDTIDLATQNRLKIGSGKFSEWGTPEGSADKAIYRSLQKNIEQVAEKNNMPNVKEINARMASLIKAQDILPYIDGKKVTKGALGEAIQTGATAAGAGAGMATGAPPDVAAYFGNKLGGAVGKRLSATGLSTGVLNRTGKGAVRTTAKQAYKGAKGLTKGLIAQKIANPPKSSGTPQK